MRLLLVTTLVVAAIAVGYQGLAHTQDSGMEEMMAALTAKHAPGEHHARMAGTWEAEVTMWMGGPDMSPSESRGTMHNEMTLGGRFLLSRYEGEFMGDSFEGLGLTGYDAEQGKYVGSWLDSFLTSMPPMTHGENTGDDVLTLWVTMDDPMSGESVDRRDVITLESADRYVFEMFETHPGQDEYRSLQ